MGTGTNSNVLSGARWDEALHSPLWAPIASFWKSHIGGSLPDSEIPAFFSCEESRTSVSQILLVLLLPRSLVPCSSELKPAHEGRNIQIAIRPLALLDKQRAHRLRFLYVHAVANF